jgi:hypothetical protein
VSKSEGGGVTAGPEAAGAEQAEEEEDDDEEDEEDKEEEEEGEQVVGLSDQCRPIERVECSEDARTLGRLWRRLRARVDEFTNCSKA